jgi:hypothetical protein
VIARWRGRGDAVFVVLTAAALAALLTYPLARHLGSTGRVNTDDGRWSIWVVAWVAHALTTNPTELYNANIFYPHVSTLAYSEANIGAGVIATPVWAVSKNPHLSHNVVVLISFIAAFAGAYYLVRYFTGSCPAALIAGVLYAFCPFIFARTAHIQLLMTGGIPFAMLAFHRLVDRPTIARAVTLAVLIFVQSLSCAYYGVFVILMIGLGTPFFAITRGVWRSRDYWIGIALAAVVTITLTLPFFLPYLRVQELGFGRTLDDAREFAVTGSAWLASSAWAHRWWLPRLGRFNEVLFPGFLALGLGVAGALWQFLRTPTDGSPQKRCLAPFRGGARKDVAMFYALIGTFAFWSSFGPDAGLYWLFYKTIPFFTFMRAPGRFGILVVLALVVLAAPLVAALLARTRRPMLAGALAAALAVAELIAIPLNQYRRTEPVSAIYTTLATLPRAAVFELPYWYQRHEYPRHAYYMLNSTAHWLPLINGYSDYIPEDFGNTALALSSFPSRESFTILENRGVRYVVFHLDMYNARSRVRLNERLASYVRHLRLLMTDGNLQLYEIVSFPSWDAVSER